MNQSGLAAKPFHWVVPNKCGGRHLCQAVGRALRYRRRTYEEFTQHPESTIRSICEFLEVEPDGSPFVAASVVALQS